jgi:hypothetical protein
MESLKHNKICNNVCPPLKKQVCKSEKPNIKVSNHQKFEIKVPPVFNSGHIGSNLLKTDTSPNVPLCHAILNLYNPLNDPHLKVWLSSPKKQKFLYKQGLISSDNKVISNIKDYSDRQQCLKRRDNYLMNLQRKRDENQKKEQIQVFKADLNNKKEIARKLKALKNIFLEDKLQKVSAHLLYTIVITYN